MRVGFSLPGIGLAIETKLCAAFLTGHMERKWHFHLVMSIVLNLYFHKKKKGQR